MTLEKKISTINFPAIEPLPAGSNDTIKSFFENFVKPRLPKKAIVKKWHELLMDYTSDLTNFSGCVRYGANGSEMASLQDETGYYKLRRGWLTHNTKDDFEYFFADNFFSHFIFKMALDGFCPSMKEFVDAFRNHRFPYGFGFKIDQTINEYKGVVIPIAHEPGFLGKYKLSHVFESGENYIINGKIYKGKCDKQLSELYYDIGHSDDYLESTDRIRREQITDDAKKVIIAKFLRFAHPFNYFLTPCKKLHKCGRKVFMNDIGEDPRMISYVKSYLEKAYPQEYTEFVSKALCYDDPTIPKEDGTTIIDITYANPKKSLGTGKSSVTTKQKRISKRKEIFLLIKMFISDKSVQSFAELNTIFPSIARLVQDIKDTKRYFDEIILLPNGDEIRITNQIGDKPNFPVNRNYSKLKEKLK